MTQTTDMARWKVFLAEFEIEFEEVQIEQPAGVLLRLREGMANVVGYFEFFTDVEFDGDGRFVKIGAWE